MNYCPNCGEKVDEESRFCKYCGTKLSIAVDPIPEREPKHKPENNHQVCVDTEKSKEDVAFLADALS